MGVRVSVFAWLAADLLTVHWLEKSVEIKKKNRRQNYNHTSIHHLKGSYKCRVGPGIGIAQPIKVFYSW
jgi:hypothetical protein